MVHTTCALYEPVDGSLTLSQYSDPIVPTPHGRLVDADELWQNRPPLRNAQQQGHEEYNKGYNAAILEFYEILSTTMEVITEKE